MFSRPGISNKKALIIELTEKHGYVIYPQCAFLLNAGYDVTVLMSENNRDHEQLLALKDRVNIIEVNCTERWLCLVKIRLSYTFAGYEFIVLNTLQNWRHLLFGLTLPGDVRFVKHGAVNIKLSTYASRKQFVRLMVLSPPRALQPLFYRLLERKATRIFSLSEKVHNESIANVPEHMARKLSYFHPAYFPGFSDIAPAETEGDPSAERVIFVILGRLDDHFRNYQSLFAALPQIAACELKDRIAIYLMGDFLTPVGRKLVVDAADLGLLGSVVRLQKEPYVPFDLYATQLKTSHFLIPLIDQTILDHRHYNKIVVPSCLMLSRAFGIPIVSSTDLELDDDLTPFAVSYQGSDLFSGLRAAVEVFDSPQYTGIRQRYWQHMAQLFDLSQANYLG